jgi:multidrug efflux pump subunit AcrA (membrane-fusion protein)
MTGTVDAPLLPESAVLSDTKGSFVYIVAKNDEVQRRSVTVGEVSDKGMTITEGLTGKEQVVLSAGAFLNPGDKIIPERSAGSR